MALPYILGTSLLAWACTFTLARGGSPSGHLQSIFRLRATRAVHSLLVRLGSLRVVALLLERPAWKAASTRVAQRLSPPGHPLVEEQGCAALLVAALLAMVILHSPVGAILVGLSLAIGIPSWHAAYLRARAQELSREMPSVFRTLAMAMTSGETLSQAVEYLGSHSSGVAAEAFTKVSLRLNCGMAIEEAMASLREDLDAPGVALLSTALAVSQRTGSPLKGLFEYSARLVERQGEFERLLTVKTAQVRLSVRIVSLMPLLMVVALSFLSPDFRQGLVTPAGLVSICVAAVMDGVALLIIRGQMRGVL